MEIKDFIKKNRIHILDHADNDWDVVEFSNVEILVNVLKSDNKELLEQRNELLRLCELVHGSFGGGLTMTFSEKDVIDFVEAINRTILTKDIKQ